jgi:hypothetical protein
MCVYLISAFELFDPFLQNLVCERRPPEFCISSISSDVSDAWNCEVGLTPIPHEAPEVVFGDIFGEKMQLLYTIILLHMK